MLQQVSYMLYRRVVVSVELRVWADPRGLADIWAPKDRSVQSGLVKA